MDDIASAVEACGRIGTISNTACAAHAQENFSSTKMADGYLSLYTKILQAADETPVGAKHAATATEYFRQDL